MSGVQCVRSTRAQRERRGEPERAVESDCKREVRGVRDGVLRGVETHPAVPTTRQHE